MEKLVWSTLLKLLFFKLILTVNSLLNVAVAATGIFLHTQYLLFLNENSKLEKQWLSIEASAYHNLGSKWVHNIKLYAIIITFMKINKTFTCHCLAFFGIFPNTLSCTIHMIPNRLKLYNRIKLWAGSYVWVLCWLLCTSRLQSREPTGTSRLNCKRHLFCLI